MKNWGDSSDDEDHMDGPDDVSTVAEDEAPGQMDADFVQHDENPKDATPKPPKTFEWPEAAPFTAYIGNLAYSVDEPGKLAEEVTNLAKEMLNMEVKVTNPRLSRADNHRNHRNNNEAGSQKPHRGFGYVELETLEQLKAVVEGLGGGKIAGRNIQLDTANFTGGRPNRNESRVDGSKFRGGRYTNNNDKGRRQPQRQEKDDEPPRQRSALKLQPRTKPLEETTGSDRGNLFGGGRPREEGTWQSRRDAEKKTHSTGGRGGRANGRRNGREDGGRGDGAGRGRRDAQTSAEKKGEDDKKTTAPAPRPEKVVEKPQKPATVINRFAALGLDSDSD
jgi:RNA recognition motif-containing protein